MIIYKAESKENLNNQRALKSTIINEITPKVINKNHSLFTKESILMYILLMGKT
jgi:hypothetical protein